MNIAKIKFIVQTLTLLFLLVGCLPAQKTTQCSSNEAFDSSARKCVPTLGAGIGNTVFVQSKFPANSYSAILGDAGITHTVSVSDVYAVGYKTEWKLHFSSSVSPVFNFNNSVVSTNTLNYTFTPPSTASPNLKGTYILEAIVLNSNSTAQLDSHSWTIQVGDLAVPQLINPVPAFNSTTYASNITTATLSLDIDNPDSVSGRTGLAYWYINSVLEPGNPTIFNAITTPTSVTFDPSSLGVGIHTVELKITHPTDPSVVFDTHQWLVNVINPVYPQIVGATPSFNSTIMAINGISYSAGGYIGDDPVTPGSEITALNTHTDPGLCITVDSNGPTLNVRFDINGSIQIPQQPIPGTNKYCLTTINAQTLLNSQIGVSKTITVSTIVAGTSTIVEQRQWSLIVTPKNSAPSIAIDTTPTNSTIVCGSISTLSASGCSMTQSADTNNDNNYTNETAANNNSVQLAFSVSDLDTDFSTINSQHGEDNLEIYFEVKAAGDINYQQMNGAPNQYSRTICSIPGGTDKTPSYAATQTGGFSRTYTCEFNIDSFHKVGLKDYSTPAGSYTVRAYVRDPGSVWEPGNQQQSQYITWDINVAELDSPATIVAQGTMLNSWLSASSDGSGCTPVPAVITSASENDWIVVHTRVKDDQRDKFKILVELQNLMNGLGTYSIVVPITDVIQDYDNSGDLVAQSCFKIPEWAVTTGPAPVATNIRVTVNEVLDSGLSANVAVSSPPFSIDITNNNPKPLFPLSANRDLDKAADGVTNEPTIVYAGFPFRLDPELLNGVTPNVPTDASVYDGTALKWQWQIKHDAAPWSNIPNANDTGMSSLALTWTPSIDTTNTTVKLRICLGDNGAGNPPDCTNGASTIIYENILVAPANFVGNGTTTVSSGNELASWYDESTKTLYNSYVSGSNIYVSKFVKSTISSTDIHWVEDHTIYFPSEDITIPKAATIPHSLSINGVPGGTLMIAYKVVDSGAFEPRIRQIDISGNTLAFNYHGIYNSAGIGADPYQMIDSTVGFTDPDFSSVLAGALNITFNGTEDLTYSVTFRLHDGTTETITCAGCVNAGNAAANKVAFETAFQNNLNLKKNLYLDTTGPATVSQIRGAHTNNYIDINSSAPTISNIVIDVANDTWYLPAKNFTGSLSVYHAPGVSSDLSGDVASVYAVPGSSTVVDYLYSAINSTGGLVVAQKNDFSNVDVHLLNYPMGSGIATSSNLFNIVSSSIFDISLSLDSSDNIFIAGNNITSNADNYLCASVVKSDLSEASTTSIFTSNNFLAQSGVDKVKISARRDIAGEAVIAMTTNSNHKYNAASAPGSGIPNQAHLVKITQDDSNFSEAIVFKDYQVSSSLLSSPKVNILPTVGGGAISLSSIFQIHKGDANDHDDTPPVGVVNDDNIKYSLFFSFHESNGGAEVRSTMLNIESNQTSTNSTITGSMPGILAD